MATTKKGTCFTCGRPIWMDEYYRWRHSPPDDWIDARYIPSGWNDHPLTRPQKALDKPSAI